MTLRIQRLIPSASRHEVYGWILAAVVGGLIAGCGKHNQPTTASQTAVNQPAAVRRTAVDDPSAPGSLKTPFSESTAKNKQRDWAQYLKREVVEKNSLGAKMVLIPPGEFQMGNQEEITATVDRFPYITRKNIEEEFPRHQVRITRPFYIGACAITCGNFLAFCQDVPYKTEAERDGKPSWGYSPQGKMVQSTDFMFSNTGLEQTAEHPVVYVSWNDAVAFCDWLSKKEGRTYRLPTEAEWEYACRAGTEGRYFWGDDPDEMVTYGNGADQDLKRVVDPAAMAIMVKGENGVETNIPFPFLSGSDGYAHIAPVGKFKPNAFGLYDMLGNVFQWCSDWSGETYYENSPVSDPNGPDAGTERISRGGSWDNVPVFCRCAARNGNEPTGRGSYLGFRVVCEQ